MTDEPTDNMPDAIRDRIRDLGDPDAVVIGYALVAEVITPDVEGPWLKVLQDDNSSSWAQVGRVRGLWQMVDHSLSAGWQGDDDA